MNNNDNQPDNAEPSDSQSPPTPPPAEPPSDAAGLIDLNRTLELIKGAVFDPEATWDGYLPEADNWQRTAALLTGPLVVGSTVIAYVLSLIFPSRIPGFDGPGFGDMLLGIVFGFVGAALAALIVSFLAGMFKGNGSFARGLAATSLAFVPGYIGQIVLQLPFLGWLIALALFIYALVLLWRIIPKYLEVPAASRLGHYLLTLVVTLVAGIILGSLLAPDMPQPGVDLSRDDTGQSTGMFGDLERQGRLMEEAENDRYDPPSDGKLTDDQVEQYIRVLTKTKALRDSQAADLATLSEKADNEEIESVGEIFSGIGSVLQMTTAEMEVVKTGGGNWAEHQWVKEQLRVAMIQQDINDTVKHNYKLYREYEEELRALE